MVASPQDTGPTLGPFKIAGGPPLQAGGTHVLRVVGCLQSSPHLCGAAEVSVMLRDSPLVARLAGGNRAVGVDDGLQLDASASDDPDEPASALSYIWSCSPVEADSLCPSLPNVPAVPLLTLLPGKLPPGTFDFSVSVSKADGEVATASVTIAVVAGSVPTVSVQAPKAAKHNANEALRLLGSAVLDQNGTASALALAWSCTPDIGALSNSLITRTGWEQANLVVLPGVLPSGCAGGACSYTFTLTATHQAAAGPRAAFAQQTILMNVPPSGGAFEVVPSTGYELNGTFALRASYWTDDADDLPLRYTFGISRSSGTDADSAVAVVEPLSGSFSLSSHLDVLLPAGSLTLVVTVQDRLGASVTATAGATVLPLPSISAAVIDSVLEQAREALQSGDPQATTQASAALVLSLNAREAEGTGTLDAQQAVQMRENVLELVSSAAAAGAMTASAVGQTASAVEAVVEVVDQVSEAAATQASRLVGAIVNSSLGISEPISTGTSTTLVRTCSSLFTAIERQETDGAETTGAGNDTDATAAANSTSQAPSSTALYGGLRDSLSGLGHLMLKGSLAGEAATKVLAGRVQIGVSLVASTALRSASFEAPRGKDSGSVAFPPDLGLGVAAAVEVSFTSLQVNTHGQWHLSASQSPATEYLDVSLSDHTSLAPLAIHDAPQPLVLLIPIGAGVLANPEPEPCTTSEEALGLCGVCDANDARLGRHNCSGHGACVHGRCWCDGGPAAARATLPLYRGERCLRQLECRYWSEEEQACVAYRRHIGGIAPHIASHVLYTPRVAHRASHPAHIMRCNWYRRRGAPPASAPTTGRPRALRRWRRGSCGARATT